MIVFFLEGKHPDYKLRYLSDIWNYNDDKMESVHDYIQWVFPLDTASAYVSHAPVLIDEEIDEITQSELALNNLIKSKIWFMNFLKRSDRWLLPNNHNQKRISRMIRSLRLLHIDCEANLCLNEIIELAKNKGFANLKVLNVWKRM